jgi:hypothetical protein
MLPLTGRFLGHRSGRCGYDRRSAIRDSFSVGINNTAEWYPADGGNRSTKSIDGRCHSCTSHATATGNDRLVSRRSDNWRRRRRRRKKLITMTAQDVEISADAPSPASAEMTSFDVARLRHSKRDGPQRKNRRRLKKNHCHRVENRLTRHRTI